MKTSNKILLALSSVTLIVFLALYISFKPEYHRSYMRNIADQFKVLSIEDETLKAEDVIFTATFSREETFIYYEKDILRVRPWVRTSMDTLYIMRPVYNPALKPETPLYLHLKGVDEVLLGDKVIYKR